MTAHISFDSLSNFLFNTILLFKQSLSICHKQGHFTKFSLIWGFISKTANIFRIFWVLLIDYWQYKNTIVGIFIYLFICKVTTTKVNFWFYNLCNQVLTRLICERPIFAKKPVEKLFKILEIEFKTYIPINPIFFLEKI